MYSLFVDKSEIPRAIIYIKYAIVYKVKSQGAVCISFFDT